MLILGKQHAIGYMQGDSYYGARATMNVWSPYIEVPSEFSLSQMWLLAGSFNSDLNSIEAGWQVCCLHTQFLGGPYPQAPIFLNPAYICIVWLYRHLSCLGICKDQVGLSRQWVQRIVGIHVSIPILHQTTTLNRCLPYRVMANLIFCISIL